MEDRAKYLVHASLVADGVVERNDVVGAVFGQTEGLLGDDLDIRDLQDAAKVGRMDVEVESENGQSYGHLTIPSSLDRVETAIFAASLEAIERIGPCWANVEVQEIEDVRAAKRREIVDRAKQLLATAFDDGVLDSDEIVREVRESVRTGRLTEYEGLPAGPNVETSDAIVVVEGRADVLTLLRYGIKNAIAVEGTNVPDAVADLTQDRTTTAFLDGDRGGDLILEELRQTAAVDHVARAPAGTCVEDLTRAQVDAALRKKRPLDAVADTTTALTDGSTTDAASDTTDTASSTTDTASSTTDTASSTTDTASSTSDGGSSTTGTADTPTPTADTPTQSTDTPTTDTPTTDTPTQSTDTPTTDTPTTDTEAGGNEGSGALDHPTFAEHVAAVAGSDTARLLDGDGDVLDAVAAGDAFDAVESADPVPVAVLLDGPVDQRLVDVAAQRGVTRLVGSSVGEFVKQPVGVRVRTLEEV